jgi:hypothetical protein
MASTRNSVKAQRVVYKTFEIVGPGYSTVAAQGRKLVDEKNNLLGKIWH